MTDEISPAIKATSQKFPNLDIFFLKLPSLISRRNIRYTAAARPIIYAIYTEKIRQSATADTRNFNAFLSRKLFSSRKNISIRNTHAVEKKKCCPQRQIKPLREQA